MISGNATNIKLYVGVPKEFKNYFENTFYASYPTSDLIEQNTKISLPTNRERINFSKEGKMLTKDEFTR